MVVSILCVACFPPDTELTDAGRGLPDLTAEIEPVLEPGSTTQLSVIITNPGPGDMTSVIVSFSRVGASAQEELPQPLVDVGVQKESDSIIGSDPEPESISLDAMTYKFAGLREGESVTIVFELKVPKQQGAYANALVAYDGVDVERARGIRINATVSE